MYAPATFLQYSVASYGQAQREVRTRQRAAQAFAKAYDRGQRRQFLARLTGRPQALASLHGASADAGAGRRQLAARHYAGIHLVSIAQIVGSEGRQADFDAAFHPLRTHTQDRWINVAEARLRGVALPPVELVQVDGKYYVRDGHHRISVAKAMGQREIEAEVTVWRSA